MINQKLEFPGDKSISHRALIFGSLSSGLSKIYNLNIAQDILSTIDCLKKCGILIEFKSSYTTVSGNNFVDPLSPLECGNSGTTARLLIGLLASRKINAEFSGDKSLNHRPMERIVNPLKKMGLKIVSNNGRLPISIFKSKINGIDFDSNISSAQIKSCILLATLGASSETTYYEKIKSRDHTENMLQYLGVNIKRDNKIKISPMLNNFKDFIIRIPGDPSSAAFFAAAAAMFPNFSLKIKNILANPTRIGFYKVLEKMGAFISWSNLRYEFGEMVGDVDIRSNILNGINIDYKMVPSLIDELPIISVLATQAESPTIVTGAEELRFKECDRIFALCQNLKEMGADIIERKDGFIVYPGKKLYSTNIKTYDDHRIAMAFSIAGLLTERLNYIDNKECIKSSFPDFNKYLKKIIK
mgnify:CR=1 FL=1